MTLLNKPLKIVAQKTWHNVYSRLFKQKDTQTKQNYKLGIEDCICQLRWRLCWIERGVNDQEHLKKMMITR